MTVQSVTLSVTADKEPKSETFFVSDMSMHFSQLKHMKNLVQTAADGGRWERVTMIT